jgi:23S rRNA (guanosine2251-2'-O)-methyltransferase
VLEALQAAIPARALYVMLGHDNDGRIREAIRLCTERGLPTHQVTRAELDRMTDGATHQGVALSVPPYEYAELADVLDAAAAAGQAPLILALDGVTDPRNLGAVIRSAAAFGAHGVVIRERRSAGVTAAAWKASAGAAARVRVAKVTNLVRGLGELKKAGCFCYGLDADGDVSLPQLEPGDDPVVIVLGAEQSGVSRLVRETCDLMVSVPMDRATESLNVSVAAGIALYEVARGRTG